MGVANTVMPKRKAGEPERPNYPVLCVRGSLEWKEWVDEFSAFLRLRNADAVDQALVEFAKAKGFERPAPKR